MLAPLLRSVPVASVSASDASVGDTAATRTVYIVVVVLAVIGCALIGLAAWLWRQTRPDRELLAPLELMDDRGWRRLGPQDRRRSLDEARPLGAQPIDRARSEPVVDQEFAAERPVRDFRDLADEPVDPLVIETALVETVAVQEAVPTTPSSGLGRDGDTADGVADRAQSAEPAVGSTSVDDLGVDRTDADDRVSDGARDPASADSSDRVTDRADDSAVDGRRRTVEWIESRVGEAGDGELDLPLLPGESILRRPRPGG